MNRKWNLFTIFTFVCMAVTACNLPGGGSTGDSAGQVPLETMVRLTVQAANPQDTATAAAANQGQPENPTDAPPDGGAAPLPSETATEAPTPTATITPTPTTSAEDPKLSLGSPAWTSNFSSSDEWKWNDYDDGDHKAVYKNEQLHFTIVDSAVTIRWTYGALNIDDYYFEATAYTQSECSGKNKYGIIFGTPSDKYSEGYLLEVACDGNFRVGVYKGASYSGLIGWTSHTAIKSGPNQANELGIWRKGNQIAVYINGVKVGQVADNTYPDKGKIGFLIDSIDTDNFTVAFDDAAYWSLP